MVRAEDVLDLLMPGADAPALRRAREVAQFLRLLCDDARRSRAPAVGLDLEHARGVLEDHGREALERALAYLLRHHLAALQPVDSFQWVGDALLDAAAAWRELEAARADYEGLPELPRPGEGAFECGLRLLVALESLADESVGRLWRARWIQVTEGPRAAERPFRELAAPLRRPRPGVLVQRAAIAGATECLLERGAIREARAWLGEHALQLSVDPRLRQLFAWTRLALEDLAGARAALQGLRPWSGPIPECLCDLRPVRPEWLACLAGRGDPVAANALAARPAGDGGLRANAVRERGDCGASAFVVLSFLPGRGPGLVHFDAAPALARGRDDWLAEREGMHAVPGEREQVLVARATAVVEHAAPGEALRGALGGAATRSLALVPILDDDGDACGWIHLEFEHHLVPSSTRLARCASAWRRAALEARLAAANEPEPAAGVARPRAFAAVFQALVDELGLKTTLRRWAGFSVDGSQTVRVAEGGEGQGFGDFLPGRGRGLARALATGGRIDYPEPDERLSVHARAGSGVVLPLRFEGAPLGLLVVESSRRRDFQGVDLEAWSARADAAAIALRVAQFRAWHRERFGFEPWFEPRREDFRRFARHLVLAARARAAVAITGPAGSGKLVVARWLHFESSARGGPFVVANSGAPTSRADWPRLLARAAGGTLVLDDVEGLDPSLQELLLGELEGGSEHDPLRIVAIARGAPAGTPRAGLRDDLALRLERLRLRVPGLAERREEIPGLADAIAERFAAEEGTECPRFADDAHALLWRQPWPGNVRELENLVYKLVLAHPGEELAAEDVARAAAECGVALLRRIPTRHPDRRDLLAALRTTCTAGARSNKTRAALYLGWDPDTLVVRLADAGLADRVLDVEAWDEGATGAGGSRGASHDGARGAHEAQGSHDLTGSPQPMGPHEAQGPHEARHPGAAPTPRAGQAQREKGPVG